MGRRQGGKGGGEGERAYGSREAGDLVGPDVLVAEGVVRVALEHEVLEAAHVLHGEEGDPVVRLPSRQREDQQEER